VLQTDIKMSQMNCYYHVLATTVRSKNDSKKQNQLHHVTKQPVKTA